MAVISIKNKVKSGSLLAGNAYYVPPSFESIATVTVGAGGASSINFTSIPSTYKHLQIRGLARENIGGGTTGVPLLVSFNGDTGNNYTYHRLIGDGSTASAGGGATGSFGGCFINYASVGSSVTASVFGASIMDIADYASTTKNKTFRAIAGAEANTGTTSFALTLMSSLWTNTAAITSISITDYNARDFAQNSTFALYGIKG